MAYFLGMDIGGTKTAVALYDREFRPVGKQTMPTRPESGCRELVGRIAEAVQALLDGQHAGVSDVLAAGVACPGPLDLKQGRIVYIPTMGFADEPLTAMLEEALGLPVALENDTNAAALCESVFGQGRGGELVAYITISTGVGCGLVHGRRIVDGGAFAAGELGHFKVIRDGRPCSCGGRGCLEAYASGTAVARIASGSMAGRWTPRRSMPWQGGGIRRRLWSCGRRQSSWAMRSRRYTSCSIPTSWSWEGV